MKYTITVTELRKMEMEVEAETREEAIAKAEKDYFDHISEYDSCLDCYDTIVSDRGVVIDYDQYR